MGRPAIDRTGHRYGMLTVIDRAENVRVGVVAWNCICDCGRKIVVRGNDLSKRKSCGCFTKNYIHGLSKTRLHKIWDGMHNRCENEKNPAYKNYGGRGISICKEWEHDFVSFYNWSMSNGYVDGLSIDRIDVNGPYSPDNCRWIPIGDQAKNTRKNLFFNINGERMTLAEMSRRFNVPYERLYWRIKTGWDIQKAITMPLHHNVTRRNANFD